MAVIRSGFGLSRRRTLRAALTIETRRGGGEYKREKSPTVFTVCVSLPLRGRDLSETTLRAVGFSRCPENFIVLGGNDRLAVLPIAYS